MSLEQIVKDTKPGMQAVVDDLRKKLSTIRTGRATTGILDNVMVDYYGSMTPMSQMATVSVPEPQLLTVAPWDATQLDAIEKAIVAANLGFNPSNDGKLIRLPIPPLNEERRKQLAKQVNEIAEDHRIAVRNVRQASNNGLKKLLQDKEISEDNERSGSEDVQKFTNEFISMIDDLAKMKEEEILTV